MEIWDKIKGKQYIQKINIQAWRVVEDQSRSTTRKLVDTSAEHDVLEELIEKNKPKIIFYHDEQYFRGLHYLLSTPFRYPPLKYGSRFGSRMERSLLYASLTLDTALSEIAFYKLSFLHSSEGNISGNTTTYTAFRFNIVSDKFIDLSTSPFNNYSNEISSKTHYRHSQKLGNDMRQADIECFQYTCARDPQAGENLSVFTPKCLQNNSRLEKTFQSIKAYYTKEIVEFSYPHLINRPIDKFDLNMFLVNGALPQPADCYPDVTSAT